MKIFFISDIHYGRDANYAPVNGKEYVNSFGAQFDSSAERLRPFLPTHDLIINLGDTINEIDAEHDTTNYRTVLDLLSVGKPLICVAGNHDLNILSRQELSAIIGQPLYRSFDLGGYHHIILDGTRDADGGLHRIDKTQCEWLEHDLAHNTLPALVYCHYPLDEQSLESNYYFKMKPERAFISNKQEVRKILETCGRVIAVFNGHLHFAHEETINGIRYITVPSFSENDGSGQPKKECLSADVVDQSLSLTTIAI